jgi:hypothetical protein
MNKKLLLGLIVVIMIMGVLGLSNVSANPLLAPPPPPATRTPDLSGLQPSYQDTLDSGPMPTESAKSKEQEALDQIQQDQSKQSLGFGDEQGLVIPTRVGELPSAEKSSYRDPNFGFSFTYPSNWQVELPPQAAYSKIPEHGYLVTIRNFNDVVAKRDFHPDEIKVDMWLFPKPKGYSTLESWIATQVLFAPETTYSELERFPVEDRQILTWIATGPTVPQGARLYAFEQQNSLHLIVGYPSTSSYISSLDELIMSLK